LRNEANLLPAQRTDRIGVVEAHLAPAHAQMARGDQHRRGHQPDNGRGGERFSGAGLPDQAEHPTSLDPERHVLDQRHIAVRRPEGDLQSFQRNGPAHETALRCFGSRPSRSRPRRR
jgi:hypothetical protein